MAQNTPVPVVVSYDETWRDVLKYDEENEKGKRLHVMFGFSNDDCMLSITSDIDRGMIGYTPIELYFDEESWKKFQAAVANHYPF